MTRGPYFIGSIILVLAVVGSTAPRDAYAHCDTLDGPVIRDARRALETGDVGPVLKWVRAIDESDVRSSLELALRVRNLGDEARALADLHFFETVVRIHRAGEGAPYEGLKPTASVPSAVRAADRALDSGTVDALARDFAASVGNEVRRRFERALRHRVHAADDSEAGRAFVSAYIDYVHFIEAVDALVEAGRGGDTLRPHHN
jgi:hypothetical protein